MAACLVLPGIYGMFVQGLLFSCCTGILYWKKRREDAKLGDLARTWTEFGLDSSKQFAGCAWLHIMNLVFASVQNALLQGGDQCTWYWINIMVDTTLGTFVEYCLLRVATAFIKKKFGSSSSEFESGNYKGEDGKVIWKRFFKQLLVWLLIVSCMKMLMVLFMFVFSGILLWVAGMVLGPFLKAPALKLLVVMVLVPIVMDGFQLWVTDNFIKRRQHSDYDGEEFGDQECGSTYVDASAEVLLKLSQRCEEATEEALLQVKGKCKETFANASYEHKVHDDDDSNFETQFNFVTRIPIDPASQDPQNSAATVTSGI
jgi:hypothetical protein